MPADLWTEKYRPKSVEDLDCDPHIRTFLSNALEQGCPHLLLYGPPGTGKTTVASLLNPTYQLNASDERGIDVMRNKVKVIANTIKKQVIVLDECENLTKDSQTCLRRMLEDYPSTTFIFCTNYYSKIIDPLKSRLLKIKFTLKESKALEVISRKENVKVDCSELFRKCNKDLRKSLNVLQGIAPLADYDLDSIIGVIKHEKIEEFLKLNRKSYRQYVAEFINDGHSPLQLIYQLSHKLGDDKSLSIEKCEFFKVLSDGEMKCINRCSDELVLSFLCLNFVSLNE